MEKKNTGLIIIIVVLALTVGLLGGYVITDVLTNKTDINNETDNNNNNQNNNNINDLTKQKIYNDMLKMMDELIASEIGPYEFQQEYFNQNYVASEYGRSKIAWSIVVSDKTINKVQDSETEGGTGSLSISLDDYSKIYTKAIGSKPNVNNSIYLVPALQKNNDITISNNRVYGDYVTGRYGYNLEFDNLIYSNNIYTLNINYISTEPEENSKIDAEIEVKFEIETDNNYKISSLIIRKK